MAYTPDLERARLPGGRVRSRACSAVTGSVEIEVIRFLPTLEVGLLVALDFRGVCLDPRDGRAVMVLEHDATRRAFPIWLDDKDAAAVARAARGRVLEPPSSFELLSSLAGLVGARVEHAAITGIVGGVVRARLSLGFGDESVVLEARPSDAICLALRARAPILVDDPLLDQVAARVRDAEARVSQQHATAAEPVVQSAGERWNQLLAHFSADPQGPLFEA